MEKLILAQPFRMRLGRIEMLRGLEQLEFRWRQYPLGTGSSANVRADIPTPCHEYVSSKRDMTLVTFRRLRSCATFGLAGCI
jgi:hypothetical protein